MMARILMILMLVLLPLAATAAIGVDETTLKDPALEAKAQHIMKELRCLVCQNQSIDSSDADLARDLRNIVRERVAAGDSEAEVKRYMVARYGDWVLLKPPFKIYTLALWLGPLLFLLFGGFAAWRAMRRSRASAPPPLNADEEARLKAILKRDAGEEGRS